MGGRFTSRSSQSRQRVVSNCSAALHPETGRDGSARQSLKLPRSVHSRTSVIKSLSLFASRVVSKRSSNSGGACLERRHHTSRIHRVFSVLRVVELQSGSHWSSSII